MMYCQAAIVVAEISQVGDARRQANRVAEEAGLTDDDCGKVSIVATELATNLVRHAKQGEILLRSYRDGDTAGVELLAIDRGPGMADVPKCLEDGYSTSGTPGNGLGAVRRLTAEFDVYSQAPGGTVVFARIQSPTSTHPASTNFRWGVVNRPAPYEVLCGDTWRIVEHDGAIALMIADGLGHGPHAAEAADLAAALFVENDFDTLINFFNRANMRLRGTRGAAIAVARLNDATGKFKYAGVGNIAGSLRSREQAGGRGLLSHNGTVGAEMRKVQEVDYECPPEALLVMHSDGLQSRWSFEPYPGLIHRHPSVIAAMLYRDFTRGRDDVTVGVIRFSNSIRS